MKYYIGDVKYHTCDGKYLSKYNKNRIYNTNNNVSLQWDFNVVHLPDG